MTEPNTDKSIKKVCTKCKEEFENTVENFYIDRNNKCGLTSRCKKCILASNNKIHKLNTDESIKRVCWKCKEEKPAIKKFFHINRQIKYGVSRECRICKNAYIKNRRKDPKVKEREKELNSYPEVRNKRKEMARKRTKERCKNDYTFKLKLLLRCRVRRAIKTNSKSDNTLSLMGLDSVEYLKEYLESQFDDHMSWDNYGIEGWHIDHIIPCSAYNFSIDEDQIRCFNYRNLRPMWGKDNLSKGGTLDMELVKEFGIEDLLPVERKSKCVLE